MRPDGTLESWDEHWRFLSKEEVGPVGTAYRTARQKRENSVDVDASLGLIDECLEDYQGFHYARETDPYMVRFPFATYLSKGQEVRCIDNNVTYVIEYVEKTVHRVQGIKKLAKTGRVRLSGPTPPTEALRLRFNADHRIRFFKGQPTNVDGLYKFDESSDQIRLPKNFTDTITCSVVRREPGSQGKEPFGSDKAVKPQFKESIVADTEDFTMTQQVHGQRFDNIVQFSVWSQTNERADILLEWFEQFMDLYRWVLKWNGVQETFYWQRAPDSRVTRWRDDIISRTVEYYFRTERLYTASSRRITNISSYVDVLSHGESPSDLTTTEEDPLEWPTISSGVIPTQVIDGTGIAIDQS